MSMGDNFFFCFAFLQVLIILQTFISFNTFCHLAVTDPGGGGNATGARPLKLDQLCLLNLFSFLIGMLKNKAQIARKSIKTTLELPGPLSGPWTPAESEFGSALTMCMRAGT